MKTTAIKWLVCWATATLFAHSGGQRWDHGDIQLICHPQDLEFGRTACKTIRKAMPDLESLLQTRPPEKIYLVVAASQAEFDRLTRGMVPDWGVAAAQPDQNAIFLKSQKVMKPDADYHRIVVHELTHLMVFRKAPNAVVPRWLDEGIALYASGELGLESTIVMARSAVTQQLLRLSQIDNILAFRRDKANLAYRQSLDAVQYLVRHYGEDVIPHLLSQLAETKNIRSALQSTLGISYLVFEDDWLGTIERRYRWYALLDYRLISSLVFVMLFFLAFVFKKREAMKKHREWMHEPESLKEEADAPQG